MSLIAIAFALLICLIGALIASFCMGALLIAALPFLEQGMPGHSITVGLLAFAGVGTLCLALALLRTDTQAG